MVHRRTTGEPVTGSWPPKAHEWKMKDSLSVRAHIASCPHSMSTRASELDSGVIKVLLNHVDGQVEEVVYYGCTRVHCGKPVEAV